jgi:hypothetical protein
MITALAMYAQSCSVLRVIPGNRRCSGLWQDPHPPAGDQASQNGSPSKMNIGTVISQHSRMPDGAPTVPVSGPVPGGDWLLISADRFSRPDVGVFPAMSR